MVIHELSAKECRELLTRGSIGRIGCSLDNQPYVVPIHFVYETDYLYVLSTLGQKIKWMRKNPMVCLQMDEITAPSEWASVIVNGTYEELIEPQFSDERSHARKLLQKQHQWWLNPLAERQTRSNDASIEPLFFRIRADSMSGLRATAD
jgi:nitroimidazol reductase NimA-like FMN-containing flavoprotein (pyridoxamine 5'-phosphate oxidase superfamily)